MAATSAAVRRRLSGSNPDGRAERSSATRWAFAKPAPDRLDLTLARAAIVALAIGSAAFTAVGVVLAIV
jgi:hypothetical protein